MGGETLAIILILVSALGHALVNGLNKQAHDKLVFRALNGGFSSVLLWPLLFFVPMPSAELWPWIALSNLAHLIYQAVMASSYRLADLSAVHPLARGIGSSLTALGAFFALGEPMAGASWLGLVLVLAGLLTFASQSLRTAPPAGLAYGVATGLMIACYTLIDANAVRIDPSPFTFIVWFLVIDGIVVMTVYGTWRGRAFLPAIKKDWKGGIIGGVSSIITYGMVLYAFTLGATAPLAALREASVIFTALYGAILLKEAMGRTRIIAAIVLAIGLGLMQLSV